MSDTTFVIRHKPSGFFHVGGAWNDHLVFEPDHRPKVYKTEKSALAAAKLALKGHNDRIVNMRQYRNDPTLGYLLQPGDIEVVEMQLVPKRIITI
jgi:hypothetical protein